jgi:hypothetical protein
MDKSVKKYKRIAGGFARVYESAGGYNNLEAWAEKYLSKPRKNSEFVKHFMNYLRDHNNGNGSRLLEIRESEIEEIFSCFKIQVSV